MFQNILIRNKNPKLNSGNSLLILNNKIIKREIKEILKNYNKNFCLIVVADLVLSMCRVYRV